MGRGAFFVLPSLAFLIWVLWPVIAGEQTFFLRDVFSSHLGLRHALAAGLAEGHFPLVDLFRQGQPLAGNPNAVAFYPTALLHLVAPLFWAFDAHLWLHLLLAPFSLAWLAREVGLGRRAAWAAGVCFALSGFVISQTAFFNLIGGVVVAPALAAATAATLRRLRAGRQHAARLAAAAAGLAWGLELLAGDPMTAAMALGLAGAAGIAVALGGEIEPASAPLTAGASATSPGPAPQGVGNTLLAPAYPAADGPPETTLPTDPAGRPLRLAVVLLSIAFAAGTLVALPQLVEFLRILPSSARGSVGFRLAVRTAGSLDPRQAIEWLLPFAFGRPDRLGPAAFWGHRLYQGSFAFYYSLYPGLAALAWLAAAGAPWRRPPRERRIAALGWGLAGLGLFLALGRFNPAVAWLFALPALDVLRYPLKFWLLAAAGLSLLCGLGFERAMVAGEPRARRRALIGGAILTTGMATLWAALRLRPEVFAAGLGRWMPAAADAAFVAGEVTRWRGLAFVSLGVAVALLLLLAWSRRRPVVAGVLLLAFHAAGQLFLLRPALATDYTAVFEQMPELVARLPPGDLVVHGSAQDMFGESTLSDGVFPEPLARWIYRRAFYEAYPMCGELWGRRYDLVSSPEALDPVLTRRAFDAVRHAADDGERLRLLAALGVDRLVVDRPLAASTGGLAELDVELPSFNERVLEYRLPDAAPEVYAAARVLGAGSFRQAAKTMGGAGFRPGVDAVVVERRARDHETTARADRAPEQPLAAASNETEDLPDRPRDPAGRQTHRPGHPSTSSRAEGSAAVRAGGRNEAEDRPTVRIENLAAEALRATVTAPTDTVLVWQRAWLPIYRARVDGLSAGPIAVNLHHLGVRVPAGTHRVEIATDRRPLHAAFAGVAVGALALLALAFTGPLLAVRRRSPARV